MDPASSREVGDAAEIVDLRRLDELFFGIGSPFCSSSVMFVLAETWLRLEFLGACFPSSLAEPSRYGTGERDSNFREELCLWPVGTGGRGSCRERSIRC